MRMRGTTKAFIGPMRTTRGEFVARTPNRADVGLRSVTNTPRKRSRSSTPKSDTESPDTKRRKLEGSSLKETVSARDLANQPDEDEEIDDDDDEEEDDFLAKELEEDWG